MSGRRSSWSAFGWSTGNDVSGHYKWHYFSLFFSFFSVLFFSHRRRAQIKNLFCESWWERQKNIGHFGFFRQCAALPAVSKSPSTARLVLFTYIMTILDVQLCIGPVYGLAGFSYGSAWLVLFPIENCYLSAYGSFYVFLIGSLISLYLEKIFLAIHTNFI